ncbi:MAG: FliA/WhiG family RNA polymerase sigma factor [Chlamydiales bacterium]|nr:FliA/WhiG family RNA polymerase sigma factor [Chlamydiales bacterium]
MKVEKEAVKDLWRRYQETGKTEYRDELIVQYLYLVKYVVGRLGAGLPPQVKLDDLYSSGVTGLIKAIEKYDTSRNSKFESYAILLIKGAIIDEMRELDWIPRSVHQKANKIASVQQKLQQELGRDPTDEELSSHMGLNANELGELLNRVRPAILISLNREMINDEEKAPLAERIADAKAETSFEIAERNECATILAEAIDTLPEQEKKVLTLYYYEELMLKEIGKIMGLSESRISQIHTKALLKMRSRLSSLYLSR